VLRDDVRHVNGLNDRRGVPPDASSERERILLDLLAKASDFYEHTVGILSSIFEITAYVSRQSPRTDFFRYVTEVLVAESRCENASIFMVEGSEVVLKAASGIALKGANRNVRMKLGDGVAGTCARQGRTVLVEDVRECDYFMEMDTTRVKIGSMLCVPIKEGPTTIGVMNLSHSSRGFFNVHSVRVFELLGVLIGQLMTLVHISELFRIENTNLSERLRVRDESLRVITQRYKAVVDSTEEMICIVDADGGVLFVNRALERILEGPCLTASDIFDRKTAGIILDRAHRLSPGTSAEFDLPFQVGAQCDMVGQFLLTALEQGQYLVIVRDITLRKKIELKTMQTEKLTSLGLLTSGIAHELNNKLTPILGFAELIDGERLSERDRQRLSVIVNAAQSAKTIVESLLKFSRNKPPEKTVFDMREVVQRCAVLYAPVVKKRDISLVVDVPEEPLCVHADMNCMDQVLVNFMNNAIDAIGEGPGTVWLRASVVDDSVQVCVEDTGGGIPDEIMGKIFDPFFTTKPKDKGTGLGLSICYGIVNEHKGEITLENTGCGARATMRVPATERVGEAQPVRGAAGAHQHEDDRAGGGLIMVVEDEEDLLDLLVDTLSPLYRVMTFDNGKSAYEHLDEYPWELIISDLRMPVMNGMEFFEEAVRHNPGLKERFMFITGDTYDFQVKDFLERNKVACLRKPFRIAELRETVSMRLKSVKGMG